MEEVGIYAIVVRDKCEWFVRFHKIKEGRVFNTTPLDSKIIVEEQSVTIRLIQSFLRIALPLNRCHSKKIHLSISLLPTLHGDLV